MRRPGFVTCSLSQKTAFGPVPVSRTSPRATSLTRRACAARAEIPFASAMSRVRRPLPNSSRSRMNRSIESTFTAPARSVRRVARRQMPISFQVGAGRPKSRHAWSMRGTLLPHCSARSSAWSTRPITVCAVSRHREADPPGSCPGCALRLDEVHYSEIYSEKV